MTCDYAHLDGVYVLGSLAASERAEYERHLAECEQCAQAIREIAGLPGLLARVPQEVLEAPDEKEAAPATLLPAVVAEMRQSRRQRATVIAVVAAALVVLVLAATGIVMAVAGDRDDGTLTARPSTSADEAPSERMESLGGQWVTGWITLVDKEWGTRIELTCTYGDIGGDWHTYTVVVRTVAGRTEQLGSWRAVPGKETEVQLATSIPRGDIAAVVVQTADGESVLRFRASAED